MSSTPRYLMIDFETRSPLDLREVSYDRYASHHHTDVLCLGIALDGQQPRCVIPEQGPVLRRSQTPPEIDYAIRARIPVYAHNVAFDKRVYQHQAVDKLGWTPIPEELWRCTMAIAAYYALPRSLKALAKARNQDSQKDAGGSRILAQVSKPKKPTKVQELAFTETFGPDPRAWPLLWYDQPNKLDLVYAYCVTDITTQCEFLNSMGPLPPDRQADWLMDRRINERGVRVDIPTLLALSQRRTQAVDDYNATVRRITTSHAYPMGFVSSVDQVGAIREYLSMRGVVVLDVAKSTVTTLLKRTDVPDDCRRLLECRQQAGKSSLAKLDSFSTFTDTDGLLRDSLVWHGATTGRYTGRGVQLHNMVRDTLSARDYCTLVDCLATGSDFESRSWDHPRPDIVPEIISQALRGLIIPREGNQLLISDFSSIECRVLAWLADCRLLLQAFAKGECVYRQFAERATGKPASEIGKKSQERQLGKVAVLGLGYGMGGTPRPGAATYPLSTFQAAAAGSPYFLTLDDETSKRIVRLFRETYAEIPAMWKNLEAAFIAAISQHRVVQCGRLLVGVTPPGTERFAWIRLPSGRQIWYPDPRVSTVEKRIGNRTSQTLQASFMTEHPTTRQWVRMPTWGGTLVENVVQAAACDLLVASIRRVEDHGYPVILSVHDEVVAEGPCGEDHVHTFHGLMKAVPDWAAGLPMDCESEGKTRYGK